MERPPLGVSPNAHGHAYKALATHSHHASAEMAHAVQGFNAQLEKFAELMLVLLVGAMLPYAASWSALWWFVPLLFVLVRPLAVIVGLLGDTGHGHQRGMIAWFGIRGIGSLFYLMLAIHHGIDAALARQLVTLTLGTVAVSIFVHGASARPLMKHYLKWSASRR